MRFLLLSSIVVCLSASAIYAAVVEPVCRFDPPKFDMHSCTILLTDENTTGELAFDYHLIFEIENLPKDKKITQDGLEFEPFDNFALTTFLTGNGNDAKRQYRANFDGTRDGVDFQEVTLSFFVDIPVKDLPQGQKPIFKVVDMYWTDKDHQKIENVGPIPLPPSFVLLGLALISVGAMAALRGEWHRRLRETTSDSVRPSLTAVMPVRA